jgi:type IX secretion system PorP/SprF family membrane protein
MNTMFMQRSQYMGFEGAPSTWSLGIDAPFTLLDAKHGAAVVITGDKVGNFDNMSFSLGYAYRHPLSNGATLAVGLSLGGLSYKLASASAWSSYATDPLVPTREESASTGFDMNLGALYDSKFYYVSFACRHLNQPGVLTMESGSKAMTVSSTFYLSGGYRWQTSNEKLEVDPSALLSFTAITKPQLALGANVFYAKRYWGGLFYRIGDALGAMGGLTIREGLRLGVAYEHSLSELTGTNGGNLEFFISYAFELKMAKREKKYKSIRFL